MSYRRLEIKRETDKAVKIVTTAKHQDVWLPKSHIEIDETGRYVIKISKFIQDKDNLYDEQVEILDIDSKIIVKVILGGPKDKISKAVVTAYGGKSYERRLYPRKTGTLKGSYLFNFKKKIYKFKKIDDMGFALDVECIGEYSNSQSFEETVKKFEQQEIESEVSSTVIQLELQEQEQISDKHKEYETIKSCVQNNIPVYLVGPAGSGKNFTIQEIANDLKLDFYFTNSVQQEYKLTGFIDAGGKYHETEFYKAFKNGGIFFLDEMDASIPEVLVLINAAIANKYFEFPNGKINAHKNFRILSAGNTFGNGSDELYTGRLTLDQSTLDRFAVINFDYDRNVEIQIANNDIKLVNFVNELRDRCKTLGIRGTFSYRCISTIKKLENILSLEKIMEIAVFKGMDKDTLNTINITKEDRTTNKYWKYAAKYISNIR